MLRATVLGASILGESMRDSLLQPLPQLSAPPTARAVASTTLLVLLSTGCSDQSLGRFNSSPAASITSHVDGDDALEGYEITVRGAVSDANDAAADLLASWYLGDQLVCAEAAPDDDGLTTCTLTPNTTDDKLTLQVRDPDNAADSASITFNVVPTNPPSAAIALPQTSQRYYSDQKVSFQATVADNEDAASDLLVAWSSDLDGPLDLDGTPDSSGLVTSSGYLSAGQHAVTLTVTDLSAKTGAAQVVVTVGPPNSAPTCAITSPDDGGAAATGSSLSLSGTVGDVDQPADTLAVAWSSSLDGAVGSVQTPGADGTVALSWPGLSTGVHTLTMSVEDELAATCAATVTWTVGSPPVASIDLPASGSVVNQGSSATLQGTVSDAEDADNSLSVQWSSDLDGELSTAAPDSSGVSTFSTAALSPGTHVITLAATDSTGLSATDTSTLVVNQAPGAPTVSITPADAVTSDGLGVVIDTEATDPEGDSLSYGYRWYKNDVEATSWTSTTVDASATTRGDTWRVSVVASDGYASGPAGTAELTIGNSAPAVASITLLPSSLYTNDTLTAGVATTDADGDSVSLDYSWSVNGTTVAGTESSLDGSSAFDKDDNVAVTVTPGDGTDSGAPLSSTSVTVLNSAPSAPELNLVPLDPVEGVDDLTCEILTASVDPDDDPVSTLITWDVDGVAFSDATTTTIHGDTISAVDTFADETWTCTATPTDGTDTGAAASASVTVLSGAADYTDTWDMGRTLSESCAFGLVSMSFRYWTVDDAAPDITLASSGSGVPGTLSGSFDSDTTFTASRSIAGSCTETYTVVGEFTDANTLVGTLTADFSGGIMCFDCSTISWDFTATR